jgi:hypothetical protein
MQEYERLQAEGRFHVKLLEMYRWGKANGWDGGGAAAPGVGDAAAADSVRSKGAS